MADKENKGITAAELALMFGVNRSTVTRHVQNGNIIKVSTTESGKPLYDSEQAGPYLRNSMLNNRKINHASEDLSSKASVKEDIPTIINENFEQWIIDLFGSDFGTMKDSDKLMRANVVRTARLAALADIDTKKARGLLIEKETIGRQLKMISASWCATLHTFPARWSSDLSVMTDQHEIKQYLIDEINILIDRVVDEWRKLEDPEEK